MIDRRVLELHGCTAEAWRKLFEGKEFPHPPRHNMPVKKDSPKKDKIDELIDRVWNRVKNGRDWNFTNYSSIYAMDLIWDAPFRQVSPTLIASICEKHGQNTEEVKSALTGLGLNLDTVLYDTGQKDAKTGQPIMAVNVPSFFAITVPMVRALLTTRRSKIVNDRNRNPFFEYKAATQSKKNRVRCEVLTSRVQHLATDYDYYGVMNQAVFQMFLYPSGCLAFTKEEWDFSKQIRIGKDGKQEKEPFIEREGLRFHLPHPSRMFWDVAHPIRTFNTDTGCSFAGYWNVLRYGDILDNDGFYNKERISIGDTGWFGTHWFWRTVYSTCVPKIPVAASVPETMTEQADREQWLIDNQYYNGDMREASVMVCEYREKLNPKQWGLGTYDHDIWVRFVTAGDGTIVYAAPICYTPVCVFKDNGDDKRLCDATLALQLAPYQDMLSNLLSQLILSVKQNLANLTLVEKSVVSPETIKKLINQGETYFRGLNIQPYDAKDLFRLQINPAAAILPHRFPPHDTSSILLAMKSVIDMAERVLQFSAQEIAQAASHEQTKREVDVIHATTNNILEYTGTAVDAGLNAMARMTYEALMNYGEDEFYAQIPSDHELTPEQLKDLGISQDDDKDVTRDKKMRVKAKKSAMELDSFATVPPSTKRETNWEAAQALAQFWHSTLADPEMKMALGPSQLVDIANKIAKLGGLKLDADLRDMSEENKKKAASDLLKQTVDAVLGIVRPEVKQGLEPVMSAIQDLQKQVEAIISIASATLPPNPAAGTAGVGGPPIMAPPPVGPVVPPPLADPMPLGAS